MSKLLLISDKEKKEGEEGEEYYVYPWKGCRLFLLLTQQNVKGRMSVT